MGFEDRKLLPSISLLSHSSAERGPTASRRLMEDNASVMVRVRRPVNQDLGQSTIARRGFVQMPDVGLLAPPPNV